MDLRLRKLERLDSRAVPLPHGTEVVTRVDHIVGERRVPQGSVGRVTKVDGEELDVTIVGVGVVRNARGELSGRGWRLLLPAALLLCVFLTIGGCARRSTAGARPVSSLDRGADAPCCDSVDACASLLRASTARPRDDHAWGCVVQAATSMQSFGQAGRAVICELLASSSPWHRHLGARGAWYAAPAGADDIVPALLRAYAAHTDPEVLEAIEWNRDPRTIPVLIAALSGPSAPTTTGAAVALERLGALGSPALPSLAQVAASHWEGLTRSLAARAYSAISMEGPSTSMQDVIEPGPYHCPRIVSRTRPPDGSESIWAVTLESRRVELRGLQAGATSWKQAGGPCATVGRHQLELPVADECLTSDDGFECGGRLQVWHDGKGIDLGYASPARFVQRSIDVLFFESCDSWELESLKRAAPQTWTRKVLAAGEGSYLVAWATEATGAIDLLVRDVGPLVPGVQNAPCAERTRVEGVAQKPRGAFVLVQVRPDGMIAALE